MNECKIFAVWAVVLFVNIQTQSAEVTVGDQNISIPSPSGFSEISSISPEIFQRFHDMCPTTYRLLSVFVSQDVIQGKSGQLTSYMWVQSFKELEDISVTKYQFQELRKNIRSQFESLLEENKEIINLEVQTGRSISQNISETENSITMSMIAPNKLSVSGESVESTAATIWCTLLVNGKVLDLFVVRRYNEERDLEWTRQTALNWTNSVLSANNIIPPLGSPSKSYVTPSLIILGLFAIGSVLLSLSHKPKIEGEEREGCLAYTRSVMKVSAFWDRESTLFNNMLVKYLDSITENPFAASEVCKAANRLVQAAKEVIHRHEAIQPIPEAALIMHYAYSALFLNLKDWAESTLAAMETLADGMTPQYEYVQHLMDKRESAWHEARDEEEKLLKQLGLTASEIEAILRQVHSSLDAAKDDSWQPEPYAYEFSKNVKRNLEDSNTF